MARPRLTGEARVKTAVQLPADLHQRVKAEADRRGTSVNHLTIQALFRYLDDLPPLEPTGNGRPVAR